MIFFFFRKMALQVSIYVMLAIAYLWLSIALNCVMLWFSKAKLELNSPKECAKLILFNLQNMEGEE